MKEFTKFSTEKALRDVLKAVKKSNYTFDGYELSPVSMRQNGGRKYSQPKYGTSTVVLIGGDMEHGEKELLKLLDSYKSIVSKPDCLEVEGFSDCYESDISARFHKKQNLLGEETYLVELYNKKYENVQHM